MISPPGQSIDVIGQSHCRSSGMQLKDEKTVMCTSLLCSIMIMIVIHKATRAHIGPPSPWCRLPSCRTSWLCSVDYSFYTKSAQSRQQSITFGCAVSATDHFILMILNLFFTIRRSLSVILIAVNHAVAHSSIPYLHRCHVHKLTRDRIPVTRYCYCHQGAIVPRLRSIT